MTLPRRKSRRIEVEGTAYRWLASGSDEGINVYVELAENPGQLLCRTYDYRYDEAGNQIPVASGDVASLIRSAIERGWVPDKRGPDFRIQ